MRQFYQNWLRMFLVLVALCVIKSNASAQAGQRVTGTVKDAQGITLIGVNIKIKGTTQGTVTDAAGKFTINVPAPNSVLVFSYVGFTTKEVPVNGTAMDVTLIEDAKAINEVVVIGYGTQKRGDITGSVASIDKKRLEDLPNTNLGQALQGAVPGVSINQSNGGAEGGSTNIQIRGQKSISAATDPLIVLDGFIYDGNISDINPTDIESINVLKDASSAAIYGSRGSNGVLLITTKKGSNSKPVISYDGFYGTQKISNLPTLLSPTQFYDFKRYREPNTPITATEQSVYDSKNYPNWLDLTMRTGMRTQHSVGVRGGSETSKYYLNTTFLDVQGVAVNDKFKRFTQRLNFEANITKWLTVGTNTQLSYDDRGGANPTFSGDYGAYRFNPLTKAYNADGSLTVFPWAEDTFFANPLAPTLANDLDKTYKILSSNYINVDLPVKGLSYKLSAGIEESSRIHDTYYGRNTKSGLQSNGTATNFNGLSQNLLVENLLNYNRTFGKHSIAFTGLYSYQVESNRTDTTTMTNFANDVATFYGVGASIVPAPGYAKQTNISQMARLNYGYNSKYLLTLTGRRDAYSGFGANYKYGFFPSAAFAWNISDEKFLKDNKVISTLKLRLSYGSNGNQAVGPYSTLAFLDNSRAYIDGATTLPGYVVNKLANENLHWETTNTANLGFDFGFFNGRLNGTLDVYDAKTHDLLLSRRISTVSGVGKITQNLGKTENKGIELALNSTNIASKDFTWSTTGNISLNRNKIIDLYGDAKSDTLNTWFVGHPINVNYGYIYQGVWQTTDNLTASPQPNTKAGYAKVADLNGDGKITPGGDKTIIGNLQPKFIYGLSNTFKYKQFTLYVFLQGVVGTSRPNLLMADDVNSGVRYNTTVKNWWTPTNPTNDFWANDINANIYGAQIVQSTSYMRLKDASLSYDLPASITKFMHLSRVKAYFDTRNLFTITKWKGLDPETAGASAGSQQGIPMQKEYIFGLNVSL